MSTPAPPVIWAPAPERTRTATITGFTAALEQRTGRQFPDYASLHAYSVDDLAGFWSAVADYFQVRWHEPAQRRCCPQPVMPGADWFPGGTLNYAEHALRPRPGRRPSDPAVIAVAEDGTETTLTLQQLRAAGRRRAGRPAPARRRRRRPGGRARAERRPRRWSGSWRPPPLGAVWSSCSPDFGAALGDRPVHPDLPDRADRGRRLPLRRPGIPRHRHRPPSSARRCRRWPAPCTSPRSAPRPRTA